MPLPLDGLPLQPISAVLRHPRRAHGAEVRRSMPTAPGEERDAESTDDHERGEKNPEQHGRHRLRFSTQEGAFSAAGWLLSREPRSVTEAPMFGDAMKDLVVARVPHIDFHHHRLTLGVIQRLDVGTARESPSSSEPRELIRCARERPRELADDHVAADRVHPRCGALACRTCIFDQSSCMRVISNHAATVGDA